MMDDDLKAKVLRLGPDALASCERGLKERIDANDEYRELVIPAWVEGWIKGYRESIHNIKIVRALKQNGIDAAEIAKYTNLSEAEIKNL